GPRRVGPGGRGRRERSYAICAEFAYAQRTSFRDFSAAVGGAGVRGASGTSSRCRWVARQLLYGMLNRLVRKVLRRNRGEHVPVRPPCRSPIARRRRCGGRRKISPIRRVSRPFGMSNIGVHVGLWDRREIVVRLVGGCRNTEASITRNQRHQGESCPTQSSPRVWSNGTGSSLPWTDSTCPSRKVPSPRYSAR